VGSKDKGKREAKKPKAKKKPAGQPVPTTSIMPPQRPANEGGSSS
jgi:hypothetical protein